jgi:dihydroflavonol-4-reductase
VSEVLVTGATGFIGRRVVPLLVERGDDVRALVRAGSDAAAVEALGARVVTGDVLAPEDVRRAADGCGLVIHLAGLVAYRKRDVPLLRQLNVDSVRNVVDALDDGARLVHVSSVAGIGPAPARDRPATEEQEFPEVAKSLPYPMTKHEGEQVALAGVAAGKDIVISNPAFVLGPGDVNRSSTFIVWRYVQGSLRMHVPGGLSFVHVDDVAAGIVTTAERGRTGERYALANRDGNLSYAEFFRRVGDVTGVRRRMVGLPPRVAIAGATIFPWPVGRGEAKSSVNWWFYDQAKAERELGYVNRPLDETIAETAADYGVKL